MKAPASRDLRVLFLLLSSFEQLYATFELIQHPKPVKIRNELKRCFQGYHQLKGKMLLTVVSCREQ